MVEVLSFLPARKERNTQGPDTRSRYFVTVATATNPHHNRVKSPRRSTNAKLDKRNVERNWNAIVHHETGLANHLLVCAMQRHALGGTYSDNKHHLDN